MAAQSKAFVCDLSLAGTVDPVPPRHGYLFVVSGVFSRRGLCVGLITRPEKSYRMWFVWVWSWRLDNDDALAI